MTTHKTTFGRNVLKLQDTPVLHIQEIVLQYQNPHPQRHNSVRNYKRYCRVAQRVADVLAVDKAIYQKRHKHQLLYAVAHQHHKVPALTLQKWRQRARKNVCK